MWKKYAAKEDQLERWEPERKNTIRLDKKCEPRSEEKPHSRKLTQRSNMNQQKKKENGLLIEANIFEKSTAHVCFEKCAFTPIALASLHALLGRLSSHIVYSALREIFENVFQTAVLNCYQELAVQITCLHITKFELPTRTKFH